MVFRYPRIKIFLALSDLVILFISITFAFFIKYNTNLFGSQNLIFPIKKYLFYCILLFIFILISRINNLYKQRIYLSGIEQFVCILKSIILLNLVYILIIFTVRGSFIEHSRTLLLLFFILSLFFLSIYRIFIIRNIHKIIKKNSFFKRRIVVIGGGKATFELASKILGNPHENIELVCIFEDNLSKKGKSILGIPIVGSINDIELYLNKLKIAIDGICICSNIMSYEKIIDLVTKIKRFGYPIYLNSAVFKEVNERLKVNEFSSLLSSPVYHNIFYKKYFKRLVDILLSIFLLILLFPVFLIIAILIKTTSRGPIFYKSYVIGKNSKKFMWYKFRTMEVNNDLTQHKQFVAELIKNKKKNGILKIKNDKRITKLGRILRRHSLDELPQLYNVLKGQMSIVGPRPCTPYEFDLYEDWHKKRFSVRPGITGLWQAYGRSEVGYDDMVAMDIYYIENLSFWLDLKILIKTIQVVILGIGGY